MSEPDDAPEKFLQRWSRRKQAAELRAPDGTEAALQSQTDADANAPRAQRKKPTLRCRSLIPSSCRRSNRSTPTSDVRAFLAPGVPEELTRAALRRAWATDPTIRDFVGLAENQWDFTNPESYPVSARSNSPTNSPHGGGLVGGPTEQRTTPRPGVRGTIGSNG